MPKLKGSQTEINLLTSFAGEAQARMRYNIFASVAKKEGFVQIADLFNVTAQQEFEHGKRMFKFLEGGMIDIKAAYPAGVIGSTAENLIAAAEGENDEWTNLYPKFAEVARDEGFKDIAIMYEKISISEKNHERRYLALANNIKEELVFKRPERVTWYCRNCGYVHDGTEAIKLCPACLHPIDHFSLLVDDF